MSKPVGELTIEPEPSPKGEPINYAHLLRHDLLREPRIVSTQFRLGNAAMIHAFKEGDGHFIKADMARHVSQRYRTLDQEARGTLVYRVKDAMARSALLVGNDLKTTHSRLFDDTSAIMNHQPLLFEPYDGAMLKGAWSKRRRLYFETEDLCTAEQCLILLGGLAAFINFLNEEK